MPSTSVWEKIAAYAFGAVFIATMLVVALFLPNPTDFQIYVFRIVLALAAGGIGAVLPGFINLNIHNYIRAGGALALFAIVYMINPPQLILNTTPLPTNVVHTVTSPIVILPPPILPPSPESTERYRNWKDKETSGEGAVRDAGQHMHDPQQCELYAKRAEDYFLGAMTESPFGGRTQWELGKLYTNYPSIFGIQWPSGGYTSIVWFTQAVNAYTPGEIKDGWRADAEIGIASIYLAMTVEASSNNKREYLDSARKALEKARSEYSFVAEAHRRGGGYDPEDRIKEITNLMTTIDSLTHNLK